MAGDQKILVVDVEPRIRRILRFYLEKEAFSVTEAKDGETALHLLSKNQYRLVIMDILLPGIDGIEVCKHVRRMMSIPIIIVSGQGEEGSRVKGFEAGADDYIVKPFSPREIIHRVKAHLRRSPEIIYYGEEKDSEQLFFPHIIMDRNAYQLKVMGQEVPLTRKEFELFYYLLKWPDKVFTREELLNEIWNYGYFVDIRTVDTHIKRLRVKLREASPQAATMLKTIWGVGYKLEYMFE